MPNENLNVHLHDAGLFRWDWNYYTDASVDAAVREFDAAAADGVSPQEVVDLLNGAARDFEQITQREARQIYGALNRHWGDMTDFSRPVADMLMNRLNEAYPGWRKPAYAFIRSEWVEAPLIHQEDEQFRFVTDVATITGDEVTKLVDEIKAEADAQNVLHLAHVLRRRA